MENIKFLLKHLFIFFNLTILSGLGSYPSFAEDKPKGQVELVYVEWSSEVASTNVVKVVLEMAGYEVEITPVTAAAMWQAAASKDADAFVAAWLTTTHAHYLEAVKGKIENLGPNLIGTKIGLVVPSYVDIDSIEQINDHAEKLGKKIIGIDPGAGLMARTEEALKAYHIDRLKLVEGSGATMAAVLSEAIKSRQWIVVTGWTPHWKFSRWELKYLKDPKHLYGGEEHIDTIVRLGLKEEQPEVYRILKNFFWSSADMEKIMVWNEENGADPYESAKRWVKENPDKVNKWLDASYNKEADFPKDYRP